MLEQGVVKKIRSSLKRVLERVLALRRRMLILGTVWLFILLGIAQVLWAVQQAAEDKDGDLSRQWRVMQYVMRGVNPYPIAYEALLKRWGMLAPRGSVHLKDLQIYRMPMYGPDPRTDPVLGPPEATYPPQVLALLLPLGLLPRAPLAITWILLNIVFVLLLAQELRSLTDYDLLKPLFFIGLVAIWPPVSYCIEREQFSLVSLWCILAANRMQVRRPTAAGLLYSLALMKPSLAIPFLILPLADERVGAASKARAMVGIAAPQLVLLAAMCLMVRENPRALLGGWLAVAAYFRQGTYTVQHIINNLRIDGSYWDFALQAGILLCGTLLALHLERRIRLGFLAVISCVWMYHARYDFVTLLIPAVLLLDQARSRLRTINLTALAIILNPAVG